MNVGENSAGLFGVIISIVFVVRLAARLNLASRSMMMMRNHLMQHHPANN
jgi:hypothetical protein